MEKESKTDLDKLFYMLKQGQEHDLRIGQMLDSIFGMAAKDGHDPFFIQDNQLIQYARRYAKNF